MRANNKWDERFLGLARHIALWSKDPSTKCGAVIVNREHKIMSTGYNGFARGVDDSTEKYANREYKLENVIHSEENALLQAVESLKGTTLYASSFPCSRCTARIINKGISGVVVSCEEEDPFFFRDDKGWRTSFIHAVSQFREAKVKLVKLHPTNFRVTLLMGPEHPYAQVPKENV